MEPLALSLIEAFVAFGHDRNVMLAASRLGVTQPTLTRQLQLFESSLPLAVFARQGRNKVLTSYGERLFDKLEKDLGKIRLNVDHVTQVFSDPQAAIIRIGGRRDVLQPYSTRLRFSGCLEFRYLEREAIINRLQDRTIDLAITQRVPNTTEIIAKPIFKNEFVLVIPKSWGTIETQNKSPTHPAPTKSISAELRALLKKNPALSFDPNLEIFDRFCRSLGDDPNHLIRIVRTCRDWSTLKYMAEARLGWTLLPSTIAVGIKDCWVQPIPALLNERLQFYLLYPRDLAKVKWFKDFIQHFIETAQAIKQS